MANIPAGALLQKAKNNVSYVYFPSYYYDKNAVTHNKEKQKRLYIGKVVDGKFIPNKKYETNPGLSRKDVNRLAGENIDLSQITAQSIGSTSLLKSVADKALLTQDLTEVYGADIASELLSLAMFMILDSESALSVYPFWHKEYWLPSNRVISSQYSSRLLSRIGSNRIGLRRFFEKRMSHVSANEYLSYDSTKIASTAQDITDVRWAPSKSGNYLQEISLAMLCGQTSRVPVMFRVLPGNVPDVKTVRDLLCRWDDMGLTKNATAVLDRGYNSNENLASLCTADMKLITPSPP